jgi:hypothetical protein
MALPNLDTNSIICDKIYVSLITEQFNLTAGKGSARQRCDLDTWFQSALYGNMIIEGFIIIY